METIKDIFDAIEKHLHREMTHDEKIAAAKFITRMSAVAGDSVPPPTAPPPDPPPPKP